MADSQQAGKALKDKVRDKLQAAHQHQPAARKISSFQITSVTVGSRTSADAGEDSADDLDESHTDDISRVTDLENETPSFSEDTFSKDDVFYNASSASLGCAPVIPTSSQYGLAIVGAQEPPPEPQADARQPEGMKEHEQVRNERFKVVKIESTEPFRRGRWMCMDYLDHPSAPLVQAPVSVDCQPDSCAVLNVPDSGIVMNDVQHDEVTIDSLCKTVNKDLQVPSVPHQEVTVPHSFPIASPGQSLTQPVNVIQQNVAQNQPVSVQSPPIEMAQQINPNQNIQNNSGVAQHAQSMTHISLNPPANHPQPAQPPPVQQIPQSFPSHQLQQAINQVQGIPQMQQMQIHQQLPNQQMQQIQNQQAQIQQLQGQAHMGHNPSQMSNMQQMQQIPQMQQMQNQGQMQQIPTQQAQMQHIQMQQIPNQQVNPNQQPLHQMHNQQPQMQNIPQQTHHIQNQSQLSNTNPQMQHMQNQSQIHPMQTAQSHQMQTHMQQIQQIPQINNQGQPIPQLHNQTQIHQMSSQSGQVNPQPTQVQQSHPIHSQMQQNNMNNQQHGYNQQQVPQSANPQNMMQQPMSAQAQHMNQQSQVSQPLVQNQHGVQQFYQSTQLNQQGQSLSQDVMANIVNSQQGNTLPTNLQNMNSQTQGATLPSNLQGMGNQQNVTMHTMNQPPQSMPQNTLQMMNQTNQNIPMSMDNNQSNMQIPGSDSIYMQTSNVNPQIPIGQHIPTQQPMINQQVNSTPGQGQQTHMTQQGQMSMSHVMPPQQNMNPQQSVSNQSGVVNQSMQNVPVQQGQMPQVSMANVQQSTQSMMQNMVAPNQQNINQNVSHNQNITMPMQQNLAPMQGASVHSVPTSVVQSQTNIHGQVNMPIGGFNSQSVVGSIQQNVMPAMSQANMSGQINMSNPVNNQMDVHISQQNICSTAAQPIMSGTNSPVVSLPVSSTINYAQNPTTVNNIDNQSFGSPVSAVVTHVVNSLMNNNVGLPVSDVNNESGGGTPGSDGTQIDNNDGKDDLQMGQNGEDSESFSGLAMALGGSGNATSGQPSRAASPQPTDHAPPHHSASGTSAVAIDNKIEQAMDLVKSHLMFAVREEVEVLKEKIAELMEKITQLEMENTILRANASQETLAQLTAPPPAASPPAGPVS